MKRNELKTGVVYAVQTSKYATAQPVLILDLDKTYRSGAPSFGKAAPSDPSWVESMTRDGKPIVRKASGYNDSESGYLAVGRAATYSTYGLGPLTDGEIAAMRTATLDGALALTFGTEVEADSPYRTIGVINPRYIIGEWDAYTEQKAATEELQADLNAIAKAESDARVAHTTARVEALRALNLPGDIAQPRESANYIGTADRLAGATTTYSGNTKTITLTIAQIDALLSLIPEGATIADHDETEDDGWTYRRPEYNQEAK